MQFSPFLEGECYETKIQSFSEKHCRIHLLEAHHKFKHSQKYFVNAKLKLSSPMKKKGKIPKNLNGNSYDCRAQDSNCLSFLASCLASMQPNLAHIKPRLAKTKYHSFASRNLQPPVKGPRPLPQRQAKAMRCSWHHSYIFLHLVLRSSR